MGLVENKVAIVTGAASGLGFAAAQKLMDESTPVCRNCAARLENGVDLPFIL